MDDYIKSYIYKFRVYKVYLLRIIFIKYNRIIYIQRHSGISLIEEQLQKTDLLI